MLYFKHVKEGSPINEIPASKGSRINVLILSLQSERLLPSYFEIACLNPSLECWLDDPKMMKGPKNLQTKNDNLQAQIFLARGSEDIDKPWKTIGCTDFFWYLIYAHATMTSI